MSDNTASWATIRDCIGNDKAEMYGSTADAPMVLLSVGELAAMLNSVRDKGYDEGTEGGQALMWDEL